MKLLSRSWKQFRSQMLPAGQPGQPGQDAAAEADEFSLGGSQLEVEAHTLWQVVGQCPSALMLIDLRGSVRYVNQKYTEITGYTEEELKGRALHAILADEEERKRLRRLLETLRNGERWSGEQALTDKDQQVLRCWSHIVPVRRFDGSIAGYFCTLEEITQKFLDAAEREAARHTLKRIVDQRTAELQSALEMIRANEERYSIALEATQEGIWDWNPRTDEIHCNQAYFSMLGYQREDLETSFRAGLLDLVHVDQREHVYRTFFHGHKASDGIVLEYQMRAKDGTYQWIMCRAKVVVRELDGAVERIVGSHSDLTLRKQFEFDLLKAKESAEAASRAKSRFLANMSHELRTPLNAVIGMTFLLQRGTQDPVLLDRLNKIGDAGQHLLSLISNILDMSKIEAGMMVMESANFETRHLLKKVENMVQERASARGLKLFVDPDQHLPPFLRGDALRLRQVLLNYVNNAIKFTEQGSVRIGCRVEQESGDDFLIRFSVADTGIGLTDAQRDKLFQNFQQADESTSRKFGGTGLGLAISKQLVSLMGGEVGVDSEFGKGSTFWFTARLRRGTGPAVSAITRNADALIRRGARVLLVDDNEINREIASEILDGVGLSVQTATNGQEALDLLAAEAVDLVLMDIQMPVMDGLQATRAIRQQPALAHLPVIAMTANAFEEDRQICLDAGMNGYLTKPVSPDSLYKLLAEFIPHDGTQAPEPLPAPAAPVQSEPATPAAAAASDGFDADGSPINVDAGLEFCGGRMPSYRRLLGRFCELKTGATRELLDALKSGDRETAERVAHSMKGVASTLGAFALSRVAEELEFRIGEGEQGDALDQHILRFDQELSRALAHIRHLISTDAGAEESA